MPLSQYPKKVICCSAYDPTALADLTEDLVVLGKTAAEVATFVMENGTEEELKEALGVCHVVIDATAKLREEIYEKTATVRAALLG